MNDGSANFVFETGALTHRGLLRAHNEDALIALPESGVWAVADGMGGHQAGDVASRMITEEIASVGVPVSAQDQRMRFSERLIRANRRILSHAQERGLTTVGSTLAALLIHGPELSCIWAGDSRVYLLRGGALSRLTTDHSEVAQRIARGEISEEEARRSPQRNVITRAIGIRPDPAPDTVSGAVRAGDVFLLCSDGLTEHSDDADLRDILAQPDPAPVLAAQLIARTLERGARDNVTAVVLRCLAPEDEEDPAP